MTAMKRTAFTLVELLVVIAIIGILVALLLPAIQAAREAARRSQCVNNLKQSGIALLNHESAQKFLPAGRRGCDNWLSSPGLCGCSSIPEKEDGASVFVSLLPYMENARLYELMHWEKGGVWSYVTAPTDYSMFFSDLEKKQAVTTRIPEMVCPSSKAAPTCETCIGPAYVVGQDNLGSTGSYAAMQGTLNINSPPIPPATSSGSNRCINNGLFVYKLTRKIKKITDGTSKTVAFGEVKGEDTTGGFNVWSQAFRDGSGMRHTLNAINTPPGTPTSGSTVDCRYGPCWNGAFGSDHPGGANFCMADGHVTFITDDIDPDSYRAIATYAGNETPPISSF
jgi:prepilin-type N-terminal cleavage/methylation domain-containing protein/prepilin-type processing-associated H-X9-DG protein